MKLPVIILMILLSFALRAQANTPPSIGSQKTDWPGVFIEIGKIKRLNEKHILVAVRFRGDHTLTKPVLICSNDRSTPDNPGDFDPYTLAGATVTDQNTRKTFKADSTLPAAPYWGRASITAPIRPGTWFQLAASFEVPPPTLTPDGKKAEQKVTFHLPKAKGPITDITLPQLEEK